MKCHAGRWEGKERGSKDPERCRQRCSLGSAVPVMEHQRGRRGQGIKGKARGGRGRTLFAAVGDVAEAPKRLKATKCTREQIERWIIMLLHGYSGSSACTFLIPTPHSLPHTHQTHRGPDHI